MQLVSQIPSRPVLLVVDDKEGSVVTRVRRAAPAAEVVTRGSYEGAWSALTSGRRYSALVAFGVDRALAATAVGLGVAVIEVAHHSPPAELAAAIAERAAPVARVDDPLTVGPASAFRSPRCRPSGDRRLLAVCGPGGTGASSIAAALAQTFASRSPAPGRPAAPPSAGRRAAVGRRVLLADFARNGDQAFLHGLEDPARGLLQLVERGRYHQITAADVRTHTVPRSGFRLLPGLRRPGHWTAICPSAFDQLLMLLSALFEVVVADITGDFEGEADSGSCDVEERNHMARRSAGVADIVVVVGASGANGTRRLAQAVDDLLNLGVDPARIQPAVRHGLAGPSRICGLPAVAVELPDLAGAPRRLLPTETVLPLVAALDDLLSRLPVADRRPALVPVVPGSLGCLAP